MRRLLILASVMVFIDVAFYTAIAPLLPSYEARFGLGKAGTGILAASYAAGMLIASLPAGLLATRLGPRRTVVVGLLLLGASSAVFGFGSSIGLLDSARFAQGIAGALIWSGTLTWLIAVAEPGGRGVAIGAALGTAILGALVGPLLGAVAAEFGTRPVFGAVMGAALLIAALASRLPEAAPPERQGLREVATTMASRPVLAVTAFVAVPSLMFGAVGVLVPLRMAELGGGHATIAAGFIAGAALEAVLAPLAGRYSDRMGRRAPFVLGIGICAAAIAGIGLAHTLGVVVAALIFGSLGAGICFTPALAVLAETAESSRLQQGFAAGLSNMAWATGQMVGAVLGGGVASAAGYALPSLALAALLLGTAFYAHRFLAAPGVRVVEG